jgi:hypothetical protein
MLTPPPSTMPVIPKAVHLAEEFARAVDLLVQRRLRQLVEDLAKRIAVAAMTPVGLSKHRARACRRARHRRRRGC